MVHGGYRVLYSAQIVLPGVSAHAARQSSQFCRKATAGSYACAWFMRCPLQMPQIGPHIRDASVTAAGGSQ